MFGIDRNHDRAARRPARRERHRPPRPRIPCWQARSWRRVSPRQASARDSLRPMIATITTSDGLAAASRTASVAGGDFDIRCRPARPSASNREHVIADHRQARAELARLRRQFVHARLRRQRLERKRIRPIIGARMGDNIERADADGAGAAQNRQAARQRIGDIRRVGIRVRCDSWMASEKRIETEREHQ